MNKMKWICGLAALLLASVVQANQYCDCDGEQTKTNLRVGSCEISSFTVRYKVDNFMGEPTVNGSYAWEAAPGTPANCLPYDLVVWLKIENASKGGYGFIKLDPTVPEAGSGFGMNVTGSPNWNSLICGYDGANEIDCQTAEQAKALYKGGSIVDFELSRH